MAAQPVEWVLVIFYGLAAHKATYGRKIVGAGFTKDYIQLSQSPEFLDQIKQIFPGQPSEADTISLTYRWPSDQSPGSFVFQSADRPHLKWETSLGAPAAWKMTLMPSDQAAESIPGDPSHTEGTLAEEQLELIKPRGGGQPYLFAIKLKGEVQTLHVRTYLGDPEQQFSWASLDLLPEEIKVLAQKTSRTRALASSLFISGGQASSPAIEQAVASLAASRSVDSGVAEIETEVGRELATYLRSPGYGLFFDPEKNHDAWSSGQPLPVNIGASLENLLEALDARFPPAVDEDAIAEAIEVDVAEVQAFDEKIEQGSYAVPDATATIKTRGSAQRSFAKAVKANYGDRCAVTGITSKDFLVASHIVPWSQDQSIRLDPSNGICLSLLADRAFEKGYLLIEDDLRIRIEWGKVGGDEALSEQLGPYDGKALTQPQKQSPQVTYLQRRRELVVKAN